MDPAVAYSRVNLSSDPVHGYIKITKGGPGGVAGNASEQDLLDSAWLQRLRRIHQLQSAWWVFPTAEHSRFQHSLGAMHLAGEWARHLHPGLAQTQPDVPSIQCVEETLRIAGLLHDCGHGPFGHFFDENYLDRWGIDHEVIGRALILGPLAPLIEAIGASPNGDFEAGERVDPRWVAYLISTDLLEGFVPPEWLRVLKPAMVGPFSADNMDYVPRDAYTCGVSIGAVDVPRLLHYSFISDRGLTLHGHGAEALLMFLSARLYLYQQVYYHRTVRRIDLQLREIFRPTLDLLLGGNPLTNLEGFRRLTEWFLLTEVDRWGSGEAGLEKERLGRAWGDIVARRLKWKLVYARHLEVRDLDTQAMPLTRADFSRLLRERLPNGSAQIDFEVDIAAQESRAGDPLGERTEIVLYDPLVGRYETSGLLDLYRRLPVRVALVRVFARDSSHAVELVRAADAVLG